MFTEVNQYQNVTDGGIVLISSTQSSVGLENRIINRVLITNTDTETITFQLFLYNASGVPTTVYILKDVPINVGETLDLFPDRSFSYDAYYALRAVTGTGHTADILMNYQ